MARKKKVFSHYQKAVTRLSAMKSIDGKMELNQGLSVPLYETAIDGFKAKLDLYNTTLSTVDTLLNDVIKTELELKDLSERMLLGVGSKYGKNSNEYEMAGGVRKSERKKPVRKKKGE
jgi:hypothetical protein